MGNLPTNDTLPIRLNNLQSLPGTIVPEYPVITYPQSAAYGDAISNGFFYRGTAIPGLYGKFVFGDITTGRLFCCNWEDMLAAQDGVASTTAAMQPVIFVWDDPNDSPDAGVKSFDRFYGIVEDGYDFRGGPDSDLPGAATISGGRADIRLAVDAAGELYVTSKSDGMIRSLGTVFVTQPVDRLLAPGVSTTFTASAAAASTPTYRWQRRASENAAWTDLSNNPVFSGVTTATLSLNAPGYEYNGSRFRAVATCSGAEAFSLGAALDLRFIPDAWLTTYFNATEKADAAISGDLADPDWDGLVNLLEYAFDFDPEKDSSAVAPKAERVGANVRLIFPVPHASTMNYTVQKSTDLVTWSTSGVTLSTAAGKTTATVPISAAPNAYLRILVLPK
ncbi:hypothetical protein [Luteolibacter sp. Populi]|uniref:hypothetical protein n=1 Tax=Luteolibacter sp. Populi TaxID=3230487 RepID=UPI0034662FE7